MNIKEYLKSIELEQYIELFVDNEIDFEMLKTLNNEDLKDIGITKLGHRKKIISSHLIDKNTTNEKLDLYDAFIKKDILNLVKTSTTTGMLDLISLGPDSWLPQLEKSCGNRLNHCILATYDDMANTSHFRPVATILLTHKTVSLDIAMYCQEYSHHPYISTLALGVSYEAESSKYKIYLECEIYLHKWLFINNYNLLIKTDTNTIKAKCSAKASETYHDSVFSIYGGNPHLAKTQVFLQEVALYQISQNDLRSIIMSKSVVIQITGKSAAAKINIPRATINNWKEFYTHLFDDKHLDSFLEEELKKSNYPEWIEKYASEEVKEAYYKEHKYEKWIDIYAPDDVREKHYKSNNQEKWVELYGTEVDKEAYYKEHKYDYWIDKYAPKDIKEAYYKEHKYEQWIEKYASENIQKEHYRKHDPYMFFQIATEEDKIAYIREKPSDWFFNYASNSDRIKYFGELPKQVRYGLGGVFVLLLLFILFPTGSEQPQNESTKIDKPISELKTEQPEKKEIEKLRQEIQELEQQKKLMDEQDIVAEVESKKTEEEKLIDVSNLVPSHRVSESSTRNDFPHVTLRRSRDKLGEIEGVLYDGSEVLINEKQGDWSNVTVITSIDGAFSLEPGSTGWIEKADMTYVKKIESITDLVPTHVVYNTHTDKDEPWLNVRTSANSDANILGVLADGSEVFVHKKSGKWYEISAITIETPKKSKAPESFEIGKKGWVSSSYLKKVITVQNLRENDDIEINLDSIDPVWVISISAIKSKSKAIQFAKNIRKKHNLKTHIAWIPKFPSTSQKPIWIVYIGPYDYNDKSYVSNELQSIKSKVTEDAYAIKMSQQSNRETIK